MGKPAVEIESLTQDERLELIERLWDSLEQRDQLPITAEHRVELAAREAALDAGQLRTLPAKDVLEAIRARGVRG